MIKRQFPISLYCSPQCTLDISVHAICSQTIPVGARRDHFGWDKSYITPTLRAQLNDNSEVCDDTARGTFEILRDTGYVLHEFLILGICFR